MVPALSFSDGRGIIPTSFPVESTLVFEPAAVASHTLYLFTVEIGDWIVRACTAGVHSVLFDPFEEAALFDIELL